MRVRSENCAHLVVEAMPATKLGVSVGRRGGMEIVNGVRATTGCKEDVVRFVGETQFAQGEWVGIELDAPTGKNDGSVGGARYFAAAPSHRLFVRRPSARLVDPKPTKPASKLLALPDFPEADKRARNIMHDYELPITIKVPPL